MSVFIKEDEEGDDANDVEDQNETLNASELIDYIVLPNAQALTVCKFPPGCRVIHTIVAKDGTTKAAFCSVEAVAIHLPSRAVVYKTKSEIATSSFLSENELLFAPETPVWALVPGEVGYTPASVVVGALKTTELKKGEHHASYLVASKLTHEVHRHIDGSFLQYRAEWSDPPELSVLSSGVQGQHEKKDTPVTVETHCDSHHERSSLEEIGSIEGEITLQTAAETPVARVATQSKPMLDTNEHSPPKRAKLFSSPELPTETTSGESILVGPEVKSERVSHDQKQSSFSHPPPELDSTRLDTTRQNSLQLPSEVSGVSTRLDPHEIIRRTIRVPTWADLEGFREMILRDRSYLKQRYRCTDINLTNGLHRFDGSEVAVEVHGPRDGVEEVTNIVQIMAAQLVRSDDKTLMMYDFAFANPDFSMIDGEFVYSFVGPHFDRKKWISVILVDAPDRRSLGRIRSSMIGKQGSKVAELKNSTGCMILFLSETSRPHVLICSAQRKKMDYAVQLVKEELAFEISRALNRH